MTTFLYRGSRLYKPVEKELELYIGPMVFYRDFYPSGLAYRSWDLFVIELAEKGDDNVWAAYHTVSAARHFTYRPFLVCDEDTWKFFDQPTENMIKMYEGDWVNKLLYYLEDKIYDSRRTT